MRLSGKFSFSVIFFPGIWHKRGKNEHSIIDSNFIIMVKVSM